MHKDQQRVGPAEPVVGPKSRIDGIGPGLAYICDARVGQLAVPLVLYFGDLAALVEDVDFARDGRLSLPMPLTLYMVVMSISIGLPADVTLWDLRSMAEKAVWRPYCFGKGLLGGLFLVGLAARLMGCRNLPIEAQTLSCPWLR